MERAQRENNPRRAESKTGRIVETCG